MQMWKNWGGCRLHRLVFDVYSPGGAIGMTRIPTATRYNCSGRAFIRPSKILYTGPASATHTQTVRRVRVQNFTESRRTNRQHSVIYRDARVRFALWECIAETRDDVRRCFERSEIVWETRLLCVIFHPSIHPSISSADWAIHRSWTKWCLSECTVWMLTRLAQILAVHRKVPIGYNGAPHIRPQNYPSVDRCPNPTTCLIPGSVRPMMPNGIRIRSAVFP